MESISGIVVYRSDRAEAGAYIADAGKGCSYICQDIEMSVQRDQEGSDKYKGCIHYGKGTYLITLVVSGREPLLGRLGSDAQHPEVQLSPLGEVAQQTWERIPEKQANHVYCIPVSQSA